MRIITGIAKGKSLISVPGESTRPITDRVKTALFCILRTEVEGSTWLDLFAGSGAVGFEALSDGARHCVFTEIEELGVQTIKKNAVSTKLQAHSEIRKTDAFLYLKNCRSSFDFIYVDPPQFKGLWSKALMMLAERPELVKNNGMIIVKIHPKEFEELELNTLQLVRQEKYGLSLLLFFSKNK